ncbi:putative matrix metalloproteinase [Operophtera brumata]|uniref:Putative matrix metalloproteinase n=1 Tax=Operophtera brumata TaxID=104452 RepID=A0A0L7LT68_OPEBR|nr:putative matrix metalloproteinase [Operophtera brumata]
MPHRTEFGGIPVTGDIDSETLELMKKKRCGMPDREEGDEENGHRRKRFAIQGSKWEHTNLTWRWLRLLYRAFGTISPKTKSQIRPNEMFFIDTDLAPSVVAEPFSITHLLADRVHCIKFS